MKVISLTVLHYGLSFLGWSLKSVLPYVDEVWILYSDIGSHGFRTSVPCPETRDELYAIAKAVAGDKLRWVDGRWDTEGNQRDAIYQYAPDVDVIVVVDSDEIWPDGMIEDGLFHLEQGKDSDIRAWRAPMIHYWRSFYRCILHDPSYPVRIINTHATGGEKQIECFPGYHRSMQRFVNHMGYAQPSNIVQYKQLTHGHRGQWRTDCDWFQDKFMANAQVDCHPVGSDAWNPEPVDPWQYMPAFMRAHPFARMDVIP